MKKVIIVIILCLTFLSIVAFANDFNYAYWKNSHSEAVDNFKNHFDKKIFVQIFDTTNPNNIQISIVPFLKIIDSVKYYKPKNKSEFYNSIGIDTAVNYNAYLRLDSTYFYISVLNGTLIFKGSSEEDIFFYRRVKYYIENQDKLLVNITHIQQGCIDQENYIDTDDLRSTIRAIKSRIDTNKPIGLYEYLIH